MQFKAVKANIDIRITSLIDMVNSSKGHELEFSKMSRAQNLPSQVKLELKINRKKRDISIDMNYKLTPMSKGPNFYLVFSHNAYQPRLA